ncbi:LysR family transcriptional regulator [Herbiconiux sp.]|uniref:LysR family transcriptional regulator n=1 Tax=Herbiconiux sp. TaxID=1871186 RepID=UPI0025C289A5|nr:LysR family transcriptional regulator [Herbiconiux sp.]
MQLDLNLLTALNALLEEESVSGAAERLHLSEPAMSRSLGRIRRATGDAILVRSGRRMIPTPRALSMREEVRALVLRSEAVLTPESDLDLGTLQRTFTVRCHDALAAALAPALVAESARVAPGVSFRFLGESAGDTVDLARGTIDLEVGSSTAGPADVAHEHVADDHLLGLARASGSAVPQHVDLAAFASALHVVVSRRGRLRDRVDDALEPLGLSRRVIASVASTGAALQIVRAADAVVVVPSSVSRGRAGAAELRAFALPVDLPPVPVVLAWHRRLGADLAHAWLRRTVTAAIHDTLHSHPSR